MVFLLMNTKDYFKDMYTDFFGVESGPRFSVKVIKDENSREIAEKYAESLIAGNGKITYYEDIIEYGRSR